MSSDRAVTLWKLEDYVAGTSILCRGTNDYILGTRYFFKNKIIKSSKPDIITWEQDNYFMEETYYKEKVLSLCHVVETI